MKEKNNICNYLDIPLQHGSTRMLKIMRRGITREKTDGQALAVSWRDGRLVAARNKGHLKNKGENVAPNIPPGLYLDDVDLNIFPLSGVSNIKTILCNELGFL